MTPSYPGQGRRVSRSNQQYIRLCVCVRRGRNITSFPGPATAYIDQALPTCATKGKPNQYTTACQTQSCCNRIVFEFYLGVPHLSSRKKPMKLMSWSVVLNIATSNNTSAAVYSLNGTLASGYHGNTTVCVLMASHLWSN